MRQNKFMAAAPHPLFDGKHMSTQYAYNTHVI